MRNTRKWKLNVDVIMMMLIVLIVVLSYHVTY